MHRLFLKIGFVLRYLWVKIYYYPQVRLEGLVFIEPDVYFKVEPQARITIKNRAYLKKGCIVECSGQGKMVIEERVGIGHYTFIGCLESLIIEHDCTIGHCCTIFDAKHIFDAETLVTGQGYQPAGYCHIGSCCGVLPHSVIGPQVKLAAHSFVLSYSVLMKDSLEPGLVLSGYPAVKKGSAALFFKQNAADKRKKDD